MYSTGIGELYSRRGVVPARSTVSNPRSLVSKGRAAAYKRPMQEPSADTRKGTTRSGPPAGCCGSPRRDSGEHPPRDRKTLKTNELKPWLKECWCIPPEGSSDFVCAMEDVLRSITVPMKTMKSWCAWTIRIAGSAVAYDYEYRNQEGWRRVTDRGLGAPSEEVGGPTRTRTGLCW